METIYNVDYFIKKFSPISEDRWITHVFTLGDSCCAQGHCGMSNLTANRVWMNLDRISILEPELHEGASLCRLFQSTPDSFTLIGSINNGDDPRYQQPTAKQRVLAALYDLKAKEQPEIKTGKTVYVTVDSEVRVLQKKELSLN